MYLIATSSQDQAIELSVVTNDEVDGAEKETLIPADSNGDGADSQENGVTDSEERENVAATAELQPGEVGGADKEQEAVPEKLQDDDRLAEIWYKRWFFKLFPKLRRGLLVCGGSVHVFLLSNVMLFLFQLRHRGG